MTSPGGDIPEGAYVGTAGQSNSITDLNNLTEAEAKNRMQSPVAGPFGRQRDGVWGFFSLITGVVQGVVDVVVGGVTAIVDGIGQIFNAIGSLFGAARVDTAAVDAARVAGENAIVENMSESLDHVDEIQRFGGAYMDYPSFSHSYGETGVLVLPLTTPILSSRESTSIGTRWIEMHSPLTHNAGYQYPNTDTSWGAYAKGSGQLELLESGLWLIYFQGALLQGGSYPNRPATLWCHVTPASSPWLHVGQPGQNSEGNPTPGKQYAFHRQTGNWELTTERFNDNFALGRATSYVRTNDTAIGGGNTVSGMTFAYLETGNAKVNLSCMAFTRFGGFASTYVLAHKVNSKSLRDSITDLQAKIAEDLPGQSVDKLLDEASIAAMVAEAGNLEVPDVVVPTDPPEAGNG